MKVFAMLTLLILFLFSPWSLDAASFVRPSMPSWDFNIANLIKYTDLVVLGKVTNMRLIPQGRSTSITLKVESVIKGEQAIEGRPLIFRIWEYKGKPIPWVAGIGDQLLLFMTGLPNDCSIFRPDGARIVIDNKVYIPYTYKVNELSDDQKEMTETHVQRYVELPVDLVVKVAKASIKDYDAIIEIEASVTKAVALTPKERQHVRPRTTLSSELLKRLEETADQILEKRADGNQWVGTWSLESVDGERFEQRVWDDSFSHADRETATFINNWTFNDDGMVQFEVGFTIRAKRSAGTTAWEGEGIYTLSGENYRLIWTPPATKGSPLLNALFILLRAVRGEDKGQDTGTWSRQGDTLTIISADSGEVLVFKKKESNEP